MIKKLLLLVGSTFIYAVSFGQNISVDPNSCIQNFSIEAKTVSGDNLRVDDIIISWDFSETTNREHLQLSFEVQPLNACWKRLDGTKRSDTKIFKISNFSENTIGNQKLEYNNLNCKCIKWKAIIIDTTTNCETKTDWQFTSFL